MCSALFSWPMISFFCLVFFLLSAPHQNVIPWTQEAYWGKWKIQRNKCNLLSDCFFLFCLLWIPNTTHECHLSRQSKASVFSRIWQPPVPNVSLEPQTFDRFQLGEGQNQLSEPTGRHYFNWCTLAGKQQRTPSACRCGLSAYRWSEQRVLQWRLPAAERRRARRITAASKYTFISCQASSDQLVCQSTLTLNRQINQEYDGTVANVLLSHTS